MRKETHWIFLEVPAGLAVIILTATWGTNSNFSNQFFWAEQPSHRPSYNSKRMAFEKQFSSPCYKQTSERRYLTGEFSLTLILNGKFLGAVICIVPLSGLTNPQKLPSDHSVTCSMKRDKFLLQKACYPIWTKLTSKRKDFLIRFHFSVHFTTK